jgi:hypothetical protein
MLNYVENIWIKGLLEKSLYGVAMMDIGIKVEKDVVAYPWSIHHETGELLPHGKTISEIFHDIGLGRSLLVLGDPGSGKTTMLLELARHQIGVARQDDKEPIPVVANLASWEGRQSVYDWLISELNAIYKVPKEVSKIWIEENQLLLLLDGLDEVKPRHRQSCVEALNQFRYEFGLTPLVVCSRRDEYIALRSQLEFEGAVVLQPLTHGQINRHIEVAGKHLAGVQTLLEDDVTLREMLESPLMLSVMTLAYGGMPVEKLQGFATIDVRRKHLFDTYIQRMFDRPGRFDARVYSMNQTRQWLAWLARGMLQHGQTVFLIEHLQPTWLETEYQLRVYKRWVSRFLIIIPGLVSLSAYLIFHNLLFTSLIVLVVLVGNFSGMLLIAERDWRIRTVESLNLSWKKVLGN